MSLVTLMVSTQVAVEGMESKFPNVSETRMMPVVRQHINLYDKRGNWVESFYAREHYEQTWIRFDGVDYLPVDGLGRTFKEV